jgi:hypothetical protein
VDRAARRKILGKIAPLATGTQDVHHAVHHRAHVGAALAAAGLCGRNERFDMRPFIVGQVARVPQVITIVFRSVLIRPHPWSPPNQSTSFESQLTPLIPEVFRRTLRTLDARELEELSDAITQSALRRVAAKEMDVPASHGQHTGAKVLRRSRRIPFH